MKHRIGLLLLPLALAAPPVHAGPVSFNRDVQPILSEYCFACHGPDSAKRKAGLRLDDEASARAVLSAGKPEVSELIHRLTEKNPKRRMPPAVTGKQLSARQIATLRDWVAQGAKYEKHWAFLAAARPALPAVKKTGWGRTAVDRFLLARLEAEGLAPSPEADRRTLIRRLSFDLTGLPPTPAEVDAFLADRSKDAYEKVVDRLLASKHHGERLAQYWLDLVRFADTGGYHSDNHRDITLYRDYVINAFNANKRFDQFTIEQLAGDLLPNPTREQRIGSGYNRLLMTTEEGGAQAKEYMAKYAADRVRNAGSVWLGLTLGCAECHNHKFDPVTTKEFYRFASFWADIQERAVGRQAQTKLPTAEQEIRLKLLDTELAALRKSLDTNTPALDAARKRWEKETLAGLEKAPRVWTPSRPASVASSGGATLTVQPDHSVLASGTSPEKDTYTVSLTTDQKNLTGIRLAALRDPSLPGGGASRGTGNFILTGFKVSVEKPKGKPQVVKLARAVADFSQRGYAVESLVAGKRGKGWAVEGHIRKADRAAVFTFAKPIPGGPGTTLTVELIHDAPQARHVIGRFRLDLTSVKKPDLGDWEGLPNPIVEILQTPEEKRTGAQKKDLATFHRSIAPELEPTRRQITALTGEKTSLENALPQTLVSLSGSPRMMRVLPRGNWLDDSGEIVEPGTPASLPAFRPEGKRGTRLDLARWLVSPEHPMTARVFVNRLWRLYYGQGIVTSLEDFGAQGSWPSHPELLDWLAVEFRESGWDVRHLIKLMVTSSAYRQTSHASEALRNRDPSNRLLARQARFRLDAELVRDNALAVSGLLVRTIGGSSVKPYQPEGYWAYLNFPRRTYVADRGENQHRRGLYTYWQRTFPHPSLVAFDAPSREECTVERPRSNTPQQALVLLNDPTYVEAARALAERIVRLGGKSDPERLTYAYREVLGRSPRQTEADVLLGLLGEHRKQYTVQPAEADALLTVGQKPLDPTIDRVSAAAWMSVTRVLLNLHETITRE